MGSAKEVSGTQGTILLSKPRNGFLKGNALLWYTNLPGGQKLQANAAGRFELNLADVPPLADEKWAPPLDSRKYKVEFYFSSATSSQQFWQVESKNWLKEMNRFAEPTATLKEAAAGLITPGDNDLDRARKIYAAVQALDNTDFSRKKTEAERKREGLKARQSTPRTCGTRRAGMGKRSRYFTPRS